MQLYAVNFIPLLSSLCMFRAAHTPTIRSTKFNCIYSHWNNHRLAQVVTATCSRDNLRQPMIVPVAVDTVVLLMMGVCAARNM